MIRLSILLSLAAVAFQHEALARAGREVIPATGGIESQMARAPYSVGDRWCYRNYQVGSRDLNRTWTETVTHVSDDLVRVQRIDRVSGRSQLPIIDDWDLRIGTRKPLLQVGESWTKPVLDGDRIVGQLVDTVLGTEWVVTRVGRFQAFKIASQFSRGSRQFRQLIWFSPTAGNVLKLVYLDERGQPTQATEISCLTRAKQQKRRVGQRAFGNL